MSRSKSNDAAKKGKKMSSCRRLKGKNMHVKSKVKAKAVKVCFLKN